MEQAFWSFKFITRIVLKRKVAYGGEVSVITTYLLYSLISFHSH
jgi:hypothetical protein